MDEDPDFNFLSNEERYENYFFDSARPSMQMNDLIEDFSSDYPYQPSSSSLSQRVPGRGKNRFTLILNEFFTITIKAGNINITNKHPKKEFFNAFIIRAIKRAFRNIINNKIPQTTCIAINQLNLTQANLWSELGSMYRENPSYIMDLAKTENGPETDGKPRRSKKSKEPEGDSKSFNNKFCKSFFSHYLARRAFWAVVNIIFSDEEMNSRIDRFKFTCCSSTDHTEVCMNKWSQLRQYFGRQYFEDLEVELN